MGVLLRINPKSRQPIFKQIIDLVEGEVVTAPDFEKPGI